MAAGFKRVPGTVGPKKKKKKKERKKEKEKERKEKRAVFCPGTPGAGKTTLTSIIIEHLLVDFLSNDGIAVGYIYCSYQLRRE